MTAYTELVAESDNLTLKEFAMLCSRNFGALIDMREEPFDAPIPEKLEPSGYYRDELKKFNQKYNDFLQNKPSIEELERQYEEYVSKLKSETEIANNKRKVIRSRYEAMLEKVRNWIPPTEEHCGLKEFMISQLVESEEFDCKEYHPYIFTKEEYINWKRDENEILKEIEYYSDKVEKEEEAYKKRNKWIQDLRNSLD